MSIRYVGGIDVNQVPKPFVASDPHNGFVDISGGGANVATSMWSWGGYESIAEDIIYNTEGIPIGLTVGIIKPVDRSFIPQHRIRATAQKILFEQDYAQLPDGVSDVSYQIMFSDLPTQDVHIYWYRLTASTSPSWSLESRYHISVVSSNRLQSTPGNVMDLGDGYIGISMGGAPTRSINNWSFPPSHTQPMAILLYKLRETGNPQYVATTVHEIPFPPIIQSSFLRFSTILSFDASVGKNRRIAVVSDVDGYSPYAVLVERVGEVVTVGPPCFLTQDDARSLSGWNRVFVDESLLDELPLEPGYGHAYLPGPIVVLAGDNPNSAVVAAIAQDETTYKFSLATRRLLIEGNQIRVDGSWHLNTASSDAMSHTNSQWIAGAGALGNAGYVQTYDWGDTYSLFRIDLSTGLITHGKMTVTNSETTDFYSGSLVATPNGIITMAFDAGTSSDQRLVIQSHDPQTINLLNEAVVIDEAGLRLGVWHSYDVAALPQAAVKNYLPLVTANYDADFGTGGTVVTLLGPNGIAEQTELSVPDVSAPNGYPFEEGYVNVVANNYIIAASDGTDWGEVSDGKYQYGIFGPALLVALAGDGMLAQYFVGT